MTDSDQIPHQRAKKQPLRRCGKLLKEGKYSLGGKWFVHIGSAEFTSQVKRSKKEKKRLKSRIMETLVFMTHGNH
jgi:hypothetical protein